MMVIVFGFTETKPQMNTDERRFVVPLFEVICQLIGTRMMWIGRSFTDVLNPCISVSSVKSVFYPMEYKPRRAQRTQSKTSILCALCVLCGGFALSTAKGAKAGSKEG